LEGSHGLSGLPLGSKTTNTVLEKGKKENIGEGRGKITYVDRGATKIKKIKAR